MDFNQLVQYRSFTAGQIALHAHTMRFPVAFGNNGLFDRLFENFFRTPAEYLLGLVVPASDVPIEVHLYNCVDRCFKESFEFGVLCQDNFLLLA